MRRFDEAAEWACDQAAAGDAPPAAYAKILMRLGEFAGPRAGYGHAAPRPAPAASPRPTPRAGTRPGEPVGGEPDARDADALDLEIRIAEIQGKLEDVRLYLDLESEKLNSAMATNDQFKGTIPQSQIRILELQVQRLKLQKSTLEKQLKLYEQKLAHLKAAAALRQGDTITSLPTPAARSK